MNTFWCVFPLIFMLVLLVLKVPVAYAMMFPTMIYFMFGQGYASPEMMVQKMVTTTETFTYLAVPFFTFAGVIFNYAGITRRLMGLADLLVGHLKGGLAHVNILLSALMGGLSGSSIADASMQSKILVPEMERLGYDKAFSAAVTATSSVITPIIPPGIILIMYATATNTSVQKMFMGGVIPGILLTIGLMVVAAIISHRRNYRGSRTGRASVKEILNNLKESIFALFVPFGLVMGLRFGMFTATEGGAICAVYALVVGMFIYREIHLKDLGPIIKETLESSAAIMFLLAAAQALGRYLTWESLPQMISNALTATFSTRFAFILAVNVLLLVVGCFFDGGAAMVLCAPLLAPAAQALGIDLVQFGILMSINLTIGGVTPPFGTLMFVTCQITETPMERFIKAVWPFLLMEVVVLFACSYVPILVTWLPSMVG